MATVESSFFRVPDEELHNNREQFMEFLEESCHDLIDRAVESKSPRVLISLEDMRNYDVTSGSQLTKSLVTRPREFLQPLEDAVRRYARENVRSSLPSALSVGVTGAIGDSEVSPRHLGARFLRQIVCVEGIVTKASLVNPKLERSCQYCDATGQLVWRTFPDATTLNDIPRRAALPTTDVDRNALEPEFGLCEFRNY